MTQFLLNEGDEIIVTRRKIHLEEKEGKTIESYEDTIISRNRVPYEITIIGGMMDVNWETTQVRPPKPGEPPREENFLDKRFFVIKYLTA